MCVCARTCKCEQGKRWNEQCWVCSNFQLHFKAVFIIHHPKKGETWGTWSLVVLWRGCVKLVYVLSCLKMSPSPFCLSPTFPSSLWCLQTGVGFGLGDRRCNASCSEDVREHENHDTGGRALARRLFTTVDGVGFSVTAYSEWKNGETQPMRENQQNIYGSVPVILVLCLCLLPFCVVSYIWCYLSVVIHRIVEAVQVKWTGFFRFERAKGLAEGDRVWDEVYHTPNALQINHLNMKDALVPVRVTVFLWPCRYDKYQALRQM